MKKNILSIGVLFLVSMLAGCQVIGDIFKTGVGVGVFIVLFIIIAVALIVGKSNK